MLQVHEVSHSYGKRSWLQRSGLRPSVLEDVSLTIEEGMCLGLLGTSGAGKSTLGKVILGLERPSQGQVLFQGKDIYRADKTVLKGLRRDLQVVFQDCYSAVNPMMTAAQIIGEPLDNYERLSAKEQQRMIEQLLVQVGLTPQDASKLPHQFSGGQLQRVNIARAIALKPKLIVLDESISSLDMVHQTQILSLLADLRATYGLSYLFITHDIRAALTICDSIAVMDQGRLVYTGDATDSILESDQPAVQQLVSSILPEHPSGRIVFE
ncbi:nickel import ATP-binding protein NikE [Paenibacillus polysaccharolyticus]|uniref:nickel import ATP-binding protein NikE n=1 Tax=Paenibacillus polysaccharolyticus TaxID=582692 RepID=UPI0020424BFB|nr:nickel import ATP-binding protein NikE [Paenibacillus polysaccharolyticus]MCM3135615.1 nickel import ATP-binding protein NikE [Paenibacillus polysaccharolyticus]